MQSAGLVGVSLKALQGQGAQETCPSLTAGRGRARFERESDSEAALFSPSPAGKSLREPPKGRPGLGSRTKEAPCPWARSEGKSSLTSLEVTFSRSWLIMMLRSLALMRRSVLAPSVGLEGK